MARPPLELETWGRIRRTTIDGKPTAFARYRDSDGVTRPMQRSGRTPAEAERNLIRAMRDRVSPVAEISRQTRVRELADLWWEEYAVKNRAQATFDRYQNVLDKHVLPALGDLRLEEASVSRLDRFVKSIAKQSTANAKIAHVLLLGMFDMAARHDAFTVSPARSIAPVEAKKTEIVAWSLEDVAEMRLILREWDAGKPTRGARFGDVADPIDFYLGTSCRSGEVFAIGYSQLSIDGGADEPDLASIEGTVIRGPKGGPSRIIQPYTKSESGMRELVLPQFVGDMLRRRRETAYTEYVFPSSVGTLRAPGNFLTQWHDALKGTRFEGAVPKSFRSTVATTIANEHGLEAAQRQLGHAHKTTTEKSYRKRLHRADDVTDTLEKFNVLPASGAQIGAVA